MHIFFGDGYLGNQLFQYSFIKFYIKPKRLFTTNFFPLQEFIENDKKLKIYSLENRVVVFFFRRIFIFILKFMSFIRLINSISLDTHKYKGTTIESDKIKKKSGIIPLTFIYPHFFQNKKFHNLNNRKKIKIKKKYLNRAKIFLDNISKDKNKIIFFHIRLGQKTKHHYHTSNEKNDVQKFTIFGKKGTRLPNSYYIQQLKFFKLKYPNSKFLIISDNTVLSKKIFSNSKNIFFSNLNLYEDLALLSLCSYGVLSNSSFSWWGHYFMKKPKLIVVPKYWLGWKSKKEFPLGITPRYVKQYHIR